MDKLRIPDETKLTKPEREELFAELVAKLCEVETFHVPDVFGGWARRGGGREFRLLLNKAMNRVLEEDGIDFGVVKGEPGTYERKNGKQIARRSKCNRRRGLRQFERCVRRARLAAELATDDERERLGRSADWQALKLAMATRTRKPLPGLPE